LATTGKYEKLAHIIGTTYITQELILNQKNEYAYAYKTKKMNLEAGYKFGIFGHEDEKKKKMEKGERWNK
jgi:hypothetical protein